MKRIDYNKLHVDKKNGDTFYNDELHVYWSEKDLVPSISVTTLIHQFDPFDEFFLVEIQSSRSFITWRL